MINDEWWCVFLTANMQLPSTYNRCACPVRNLQSVERVRSTHFWIACETMMRIGGGWRSIYSSFFNLFFHANIANTLLVCEKSQIREEDTDMYSVRTSYRCYVRCNNETRHKWSPSVIEIVLSGELVDPVEMMHRLLSVSFGSFRLFCAGRHHCGGTWRICTVSH